MADHNDLFEDVTCTPMLFIRSLELIGEDGHPLFWSEQEGWVSFRDADWFDSKKGVSMPPDAVWQINTGR